ncbi:class I SAM-dependent methyltransferase [candidate division TA06 bacterium]|uniref:Class I SAM-dependent methyltransferase n=1 Tax=candidate division TA06 bacterium TaxID=2250710 RepID=A0A933IB97_UNCT6|nr:class I SAM-dependent methyltransferase [candidate division TA06 bacterium]
MNKLDIVTFWDKCFARTPADKEYLGMVKFTSTIARLREYKASKVLDVGCGYGNWAIALAKAGFEVTAVDISSEVIRIVDDRAKQEGVNITTIICPAQNIKLPKAPYDAVICNSVLDHMRLSDATRTIQHIKNALKPGGIAFISFDGFEQADPGSYSVLKDGTRLYRKGRFSGMLWRYFTNNEIIDFCKDTKIVDFFVKSNGKRNVWFVKK